MHDVDALQPALTMHAWHNMQASDFNDNDDERR
jgi:hypothetical protein